MVLLDIFEASEHGRFCSWGLSRNGTDMRKVLQHLTHNFSIPIGNPSSLRVPWWFSKTFGCCERTLSD